MALIKCPECGEMVSDRATVCIHCGFPLKEELKRKENDLQGEGLNSDIDLKVTSKLEELHSIIDEFITKYTKQQKGDPVELKPKLHPIIRSIQDDIVSLNENKKNEINDTIAEYIVDACKAIFGRKKYATGNYSDLFSQVAFPDISKQEMQKILDYIIVDVGEYQGRLGEYMSFWYPIEQILKYGSADQQEKMNNFLDGSYEVDEGGIRHKVQVINRRHGFDAMVSRYSSSYVSILEPDKEEQIKDPALIKAERAEEKRKTIRNAIIAVAAVVGGIIILIAVFEYTQHAHTRAQKAFEQSYSNYQKTQSTLNELEREKSAVDSAIDALESNK